MSAPLHSYDVCPCVCVCVLRGLEVACVVVNNSQQALETVLFYMKRSLLHIQMIHPTGVIKKHVWREPANLTLLLMSYSYSYIKTNTY